MQQDMPKILAPFNEQQVASLNKFQKAGFWHPFTCPRVHLSPQILLWATEDGWECEAPYCSYTQEWAWEFMSKEEQWPNA